MKKLLFIGLILISLICLYAHSEDFVIGNYSYLKPHQSFFNDMADKMEEANFNMTIWEPSNSSTATNDKINTLYDNSIDSYLYDQITNFDNSGDISGISLRNLSMGNFYQFEAEYDRHSTLNNSDDRYFYHFNITRPGERLGFNDYTWKCDPDSHDAGVIIDSLTYRWHEYYIGNNGACNNNPLSTIGKEFQFAYRNAFNDDNYLEGNKLYVSFIYKINDSADNSDCLTFALKLFGKRPGDLEDSWQNIEIGNTVSPEEENTMFTYTAAELLDDDYSSIANPSNPDGFRKVTFYLELEDLLLDDNQFLKGADTRSQGYLANMYANLRLKGIMPYVYWEGNHEIELDYVEIEDDIHKLLDDSTISNTATLIENRINQYINQNGVVRLYTKDEPTFTHFDSYKKLEQLFSNDQNINILTTNNLESYVLKKNNGERFSHLNLFDIKTQQEAKEIMVDYYPLKSHANWNDPDSNNMFIQFFIDWYASATYRRAKFIADDRPLYAVPCTTGRWDTVDSCWDYYQYPTINMVKCLQYLPLCYGVDGVIDYRLYSTSTANEVIWYALLDTEGGITETPQYEAIKQANAKLEVYGPILKDLEWIDATTISTNGIDDLHTGINANIYNNNDEGLFYSDSDPYFSTSDISINPDSDNNDLYNGYVHIGFFKDTDNYPTYMLVNRRTDYVNGTATNMKYIDHETMTKEYDQQTDFIEASSQFVEFDLDQNIVDEFGEYVALFDPASKHSYYKNESAEICVEIDPGEGIMLELASTLPDVITENITLKSKVLIDATNTIVIPQNFIIETDETSKVYINQNIQISNGAKLILRGDVEINSTITVNEGGVLEIEDSPKCTFSESSFIYLNGGQLEVNNSLLTNNNSQWQGITSNFYSESEGLIIENSQIKGYEGIYLFKTPVTINNSSFYPFNTSLTISLLSATNRTVQISNSTFTPMNNRAEGVTIVNTDSISIDINNVQFNRLNNAVWIKDSNLEHFSIANSTFNDCITGIYLEPSQELSVSICSNEFYNCSTGIKSVIEKSHGTISDCSFSCNDYTSQCTGVDLSFDGLRILDCDFNYLNEGVKAELTTYSGDREYGIQSSEFNNCNYAIISRGANMFVRNSIFYRNVYGIVSFEESNLNLANNANNQLKNVRANILFPYNYGNSYMSNIQLISGHNDFYHESQDGVIGYDYLFSSDYYQNPLSRPINGSKNWYEDDVVRISPRSAQSYVEVNLFDNEPNVDTIPVDPRFFLALIEEQNFNYENASSIYREILDEALISEEEYRSSCIDGVFRCDFLVNQNFNAALTYLEEKKAQYTLIDESFVKLIDSYIIKVKLIKKEYQDVIAILEERINNPTSEIDSLSAVLDLEIVLKIAEGYLGKAQVNTTLAQYRYKDLAEYEAQHTKHWDMLMALSNLPETDNFVEMIPDKVDVMNYPNPFNPDTTIRFGIPKSGNAEVSIYNLKGQLVKSLFKGYKEAGYHSVVWNGRNRNNQSVASGIYFSKITCEGKSKVTKLMLMK